METYKSKSLTSLLRMDYDVDRGIIVFFLVYETIVLPLPLLKSLLKYLSYFTISYTSTLFTT